ncbi:MAG: hypothetical protein WKG07_46960 [Hymenobacter sp.]
MHSLVAARLARPGQQFWLQAGTHDETNDRNGNGVIDAIDDTLDLLAALAGQGLPPPPPATWKCPAATTTPIPGAASCPIFCVGPSVPAVPASWSRPSGPPPRS